jgi:hypothetical protein
MLYFFVVYGIWWRLAYLALTKATFEARREPHRSLNVNIVCIKAIIGNSEQSFRGPVIPVK